MTSIEQHIRTLLFKHECVVVPGFGAFLANYVPVESNPNGTLLMAPKKQLTFNASLKLNDGVLVSHIAQTEGVTNEKALEIINEKVQQYKQLLSKYGKFKIENLGLLYVVESKVLFEPDSHANFLLSAFGLESVVLPNVKTLHIDKPVNQTRWYWAAAVSIPLMGVALWWSVNNNGQQMLSTLNPFKAASQTYEARMEVPTFNQEEILEENAEKKDGEIIENKLEDVKAVAVSANNYFVVAGCFKERNNAELLMNNLKNNGFNNALVIDQHKGLHRVAFAGFSNGNEAREFLDAIRKNTAKDAWLLIRK